MANDDGWMDDHNVDIVVLYHLSFPYLHLFPIYWSLSSPLTHDLWLLKAYWDVRKRGEAQKEELKIAGVSGEWKQSRRKFTFL